MAQTPEDCKKLTIPEEKINCLLKLADRTQNDEICTLLPEIKNSKNIEECIRRLIIDTQGYKECEKFKTEQGLQTCYYYWAQLANKTEENSKICDLLKNTTEKDHCFMLYLYYFECENIINIDDRNFCYNEKAKNKCLEKIKIKEKCSLDLCKKITDSYESFECLSILNSWMKYKGIISD